MVPTKQQQQVAKALGDVYDEWAGFGFGKHIDGVVNTNTFAFIVGVLLDGGGVKAEQAWQGMVNLSKRFKREGIPFTPAAVAATSLPTLKRLANEKPCIHRFPDAMANLVREAARTIVNEYDGDADALLDAYSAREVFHRLLHIKGIGDKKANMAVRLLVDEMDYEYEDIEFMNVPVDVQVERVFRRSGLSTTGVDHHTIQRAAASLSPDAPWRLDSAWHVGFNWCTQKKAYCDGNPKAEEYDEAASPCPLRKVCPKLK